MGFLDLFRKDEVIGSRVLVCSLDAGFRDLMDADRHAYSQFYASTETAVFDASDGLIAALAKRYDIVHLFCDVLPDGKLADSSDSILTGTQLIQKCCESNVKLLWIASNNESDRYISGFNARAKRINLVMTLDRNGPKFSEFLEKLLFKIFYGDTLPVAWVALVPQRATAEHANLPSCIFYAGRGGAKLR
jgi:hypothetical protein